MNAFHTCRRTEQRPANFAALQGWLRPGAALALVGWLWGSTGILPAAVFTVSTSSDSGAGSLRQAILDANAAADLDTIQFAIPGGGPFSITALSQLPALSAPVVIDATTQSGYVNQPRVELNGLNAGAGSVGLRVITGGCTIRGLAINRFNTDGIRLESSFNTIQGNFIGTDVTGTLARANGQYGIFSLGGSTNTIGGTTPTARNVISGGNDTGIYLLNCAGNVVQGNYIGVTAAGTADLGNLNNGIVLFAAPGNIIGGPTAGARNIIAGNDASGLNLNTPDATGNVIQGNYIGVNVTGSGAISNTADGITLNDAAGNTIGGPTAGAGNVISGNGKAGIYFAGANTRSNVVQGNLIGTDSSGTTAVPNNFAGVTLTDAVGNTIGGGVAARNIISGNRQEGIFLGANSRSNLVQGNFIGTQIGGTAALGNTASGIALNNAPNNFIGSSTAGAGNVISGNGYLGIWFINANATGNQVRGNLIGLTANGSSSLGNVNAGLGFSDAGGNVIGGAGATEGNTISGNGFPANNGGVFIAGSLARANRLLGNRIGTDLTGTAALANRYEGIYLISANSNVIGGALAGEGNIIAGNTTRGLRLTNSLYTEIRGNLIGTRSDGATSLANGQFNLELEENSSFNTIGGLAGGAGNRIAFSGGGFAAIRIRDTATNNALLGNAIFSNSGLGIDNGAAGVTANDDCDGDGGGNQQQNFPVLTQAYGGSSLGVRGTFNSRPNQTYRLQFFANSSCDATGNGEGQSYLGDTLVTNGVGCATNFVVNLPIAVTPGQFVTATATDAANNTSEFSACFTIATPPQLQITTTGATTVAIAWTNTAPGFVLRETASLTPPINWSLVTNTPLNVAGRFVVSLTTPAASRFYRLSFE